MRIELKIYYSYYSSSAQRIELKLSECVTYDAYLCTMYLVYAKLLLNSCINCTGIYYSYNSLIIQGITLKFSEPVHSYDKVYTIYLVFTEPLLNS